jgi:AcrR family transcriptional regulator
MKTAALALDNRRGTRKRDRVRTNLISAANELLEAQGFESSTTAEIAARAGVSQRTFFRYFACKEDIVLDWLDDYMKRLCDRLRKRPIEETDLEALRRGMDHFCHLPQAEIERVEFLQKLTDASWTLRASLLTKWARWEAHIAKELERRGVAAIRAAYLANFAIGILNVTFRDRPIRDQDLIESFIDAGFTVLKGPAEGDDAAKNTPGRAV